MVEPNTAPEDDPRAANFVNATEFNDPNAMLQNILQSLGQGVVPNVNPTDANRTANPNTNSNPNPNATNAQPNPTMFSTGQFSTEQGLPNVFFGAAAAQPGSGTPFVMPGIVNAAQIRNFFQNIMGGNAPQPEANSEQARNANTETSNPPFASAQTQGQEHRPSSPNPAEHMTGAYVNTPLNQPPSYAASTQPEFQQTTSPIFSSSSTPPPPPPRPSQPTSGESQNTNPRFPFSAQSFVFSVGPNGALHQVNTSTENPQNAQAGAIPITDLGSILERIFGSLNQPGAQQGEGEPFNPANMFSNIFNLSGNPGDYAWGARGLDDIISQLMEQAQGHNAPAPAPEDVIAKMKVQKPPKELIDEEGECTICMEMFKINDDVIQLPCKHYFHENCIKPWLRVNGTCAICRAPVDPNSQQRNNTSTDSANGHNPSNHANPSTSTTNDQGATLRNESFNAASQSNLSSEHGHSSRTPMDDFVDEEPLE